MTDSVADEICQSIQLEKPDSIQPSVLATELKLSLVPLSDLVSKLCLSKMIIISGILANQAKNISNSTRAPECLSSDFERNPRKQRLRDYETSFHP
jgi:hypothetical protein